MKFVYISHGNIPSQWAHTVQSMKMSQALARRVSDFTLVTGIHWSQVLRRRFDFETFYGVTDRFRIARLPVPGFSRKRIFDHVFSEEFSKRAVDWAICNGADFIYTRTPAALPHCVASGIPFAFESHHLQEDERLDLIKQHASAKNLKAIVTITEYLRQKFIALGLPEEKLFVFPDAVDMAQFDSLDATAARSQFKFPRGKFVAGYCGHLYRDRGIEEIIEAAKQLPDVHFALAGGWEKDVDVYREATAGILNIEFIGHIEHTLVPVFLAACDCLLMPYSASCSTAPAMSPMKMFEYMAANRPVVASDLSSVRTVLRNDENSLLVAPDCANSLTGAIAELASSADLRTRLANKASVEVRQFTWDARARGILDFINVRNRVGSAPDRECVEQTMSLAIQS